MVYHTLKELGNNTLQLSDVIYFYINNRQLKYSVQSNYLSNELKTDNAEIFTILNINKSDFCRLYYGYNHGGGNWPTCRQRDFAALTRVVRALYQEIKYKEAKEDIKDSYITYSIQKLPASLSDILPNKLLIAPSVLEKKEDTSSNIVTKRKSKVKRIIGEEPIKLNNY